MCNFVVMVWFYEASSLFVQRLLTTDLDVAHIENDLVKAKMVSFAIGDCEVLDADSGFSEKRSQVSEFLKDERGLPRSRRSLIVRHL